MPCASYSQSVSVQLIKVHITAWPCTTPGWLGGQPAQSAAWRSPSPPGAVTRVRGKTSLGARPKQPSSSTGARFILQCIHLIASLWIFSLQNGQIPPCLGFSIGIVAWQCLHRIASAFTSSLQKGHWRVDGFGSRMVEAPEKGCTFTFFVLVSASGCKKVRNSLFSMTYNLRCRRTSRRRKAFRCALG
jgi:hypothetical protein